MESNNARCEMCVQKGSIIDRVAVFLCFVCEMFVCVNCMSDHSSHDGMSVGREGREGMRWISERERMKEKRKGLGKTSKRMKFEDESERQKTEKEKEKEDKTGIRRIAKTREMKFEDESERQKTEKEKEKEDKTGIRRIAKKLWDDVMNESEIESEEMFKTNKVSICDRVNVKHELDQNCCITGLCGLENRRWVACDFCHSCIKIFKLGSHVMQRYIRFVGARPWDVTEIDLKQNYAEPSLVSGSSSGISGTDRADPDKQCLIAVTLPWERQIMFIDVSKKPALLHKVLYTERQCRSIEFYEDKIFTVCSEGRHVSLWFVYIKSTDGDTLHMFDTGIYGDFPFHGPYLAVVSGRVYLTDWDNNKVQCRNVEGQVIADITIKGSRPAGIIVDPDNNVYVCAWRHDTVYKLDADLTRYNSVLDRTTDYVGRPDALCYYRDKLFISHVGPPSLCNVVTVVRLS